MDMYVRRSSMKITKIESAAQIVSRWSGGTTTQLAICPENAAYADRDFLWRVSSAVVELPESDFTPLPDYDRILMILDGELALSHDGGEEYTLRALEQTSFDGASHTFSRGQVTDFNLMMRKNRCTGRVEAKLLQEGAWTNPLQGAYSTHLFYCVDGSAEINTAGEQIRFAKGEALLLESDNREESCEVNGNALLVLAEMKLR